MAWPLIGSAGIFTLAFIDTLWYVEVEPHGLSVATISSVTPYTNLQESPWIQMQGKFLMHCSFTRLCQPTNNDMCYCRMIYFTEGSFVGTIRRAGMDGSNLVTRATSFSQKSRSKFRIYYGEISHLSHLLKIPIFGGFGNNSPKNRKKSNVLLFFNVSETQNARFSRILFAHPEKSS